MVKKSQKYGNILILRNKMDQVMGHFSDLMRKAWKLWETLSSSLLRVGSLQHIKQTMEKSLHLCEQDKEFEIYELIILCLMVKNSQSPFLYCLSNSFPTQLFGS